MVSAAGSSRQHSAESAGHGEPVALVIGEALVDIVHESDGRVRQHPGGSPANVALGLARLGRTVCLSTWFGADAHGRLLAEHLTSAQVQLTDGSGDADRTSTAVARLGADGGAQYTFDLAWQVPPTRVTPDVHVIHSGSIAATIDPGAQDVHDLLRTGSAHATISYDPNVRPTIMGDVGAARSRIESLVALADVVKVSDEDLTWLYPDQDPVAAARAWAGTGPALVVLTRGAQETVGLCTAGQVRVPTPTVRVVDTVGAGDSAMAALLDGLWRQDLLGADRRSALHQIDPATLTAVLNQAAAAAALTVSRAGANPPTAAELDAWTAARPAPTLPTAAPAAPAPSPAEDR